MRGHEKIIELRRGGVKPKFVFINDYPCKTDWFEHSDHATVCTHGDVIQLLDMRFLVGLRVSISSPSETRSKAIFEKVKLAKAAAVAANHVQEYRHQYDQDGWCEVWNAPSMEVSHG